MGSNVNEDCLYGRHRIVYSDIASEGIVFFVIINSRGLRLYGAGIQLRF